jgi:hypothetical protein
LALRARRGIKQHNPQVLHALDDGHGPGKKQWRASPDVLQLENKPRQHGLTRDLCRIIEALHGLSWLIAI